MTFLAPGMRYEFSLEDRGYTGKFISYQKVGAVEFLKVIVDGHPIILNPANIICIMKESSRDIILENIFRNMDELED